MLKLNKTLRENVAFYVAAVILIIFNLLLINLPLTKILGYEFSAVNSFVLVIISNLLTINFLKQNKSHKSLLINLTVLLFIPVLISLINSVFTMFCSFTDGLLFYIIITFPSVIVGLSIGIFAFTYAKKYHRTLSILIILLLVVISILEIYFYPQVYFYSPLIGYFPGNIYDEGLSPGWKLIFHQILISIYFIFLPYIYFNKNGIISDWKKKIFAVMIFVPVIFQFISPELGLSTTYSKLESHLSKSISSENFTLYYSSADSSEAQLIALHQEYYYQLLKKKLGIVPAEKIKVYVYDSAEQKKELFGAGNADVAKPWQYSIYISRESWQRTLKHEIAHIFSAEFGWGIFKVAKNFNAASIEGFAQAIEGMYDDLDINELASLAYNEGYSIDLADLFDGFNFFKSNSLLAYNYSGAFYDFLIKEYGIEKVKRFYNTGDFELSFNADKSDIFRKFIDQLKVNTSLANKNMADYYFGRLSIIQKICPRFVADRIQKAWEYLNNKKYSDAEELFNQINSKVINYSAIMGLSELYYRTDKLIQSIEIIEKQINKFHNTPYYYNLTFRLADLYVKAGNITRAKELYEKIYNDNPHFGLIRSSAMRLSLIKENLLTDYLTDNDTIKFNILKSLNRAQYDFNSIPSLISIAKKLNFRQDLFRKIFDKTFLIDDVSASYGVYSLSQYFLEKGDYNISRKLASLSLRQKVNNPFNKVMKENFDKANWFFYNADKIKSTFIIN